MPIGIEDRTAECGSRSLAVADLAGGKWPDLARKAAVALVATATSDTPPSLNIRLLSDLRTVFDAADAAVQATTPKGLPTKMILEALHALEDAPWSHLKEPLNDHSLAGRLHGYGIKSDKLRPQGRTSAKAIAMPISVMRGGATCPLRLLPAPREGVTTVTTVTSEAFQAGARDAPGPRNIAGADDPSHHNGQHPTPPSAVTDVTDVTPFSEAAEKTRPKAAEDLDKGLKPLSHR